MSCRLYLITPPKIGHFAAFKEQLETALAAGDVACLQVRFKDADDEDVLAATRAIIPLCHEHDVAVLMNDRPDLARKSGCDGVHIGQEDTPYKEARAVLGADATIGVTCHNSRHLAMVAAEAGADYVAFGSFFPSPTKSQASPADLEILSVWSEIATVPSVAIGGLTVDNCRTVVEAGADFLAVSAGVWNHPEGSGAAVTAFNALFDQVLAEND